MNGIAMLSSALIAAQLAVGGATAAGPPTTLQQLVLTPAYQSNIARLFAALPPDVFQRCPSLVSTGSRTTVIQPAAFNDQGFPIYGLWKQSFPVSGCGNDTTINFFFMGQPGGKISSITAAPGDTHADVTLQRDAYRYVALAAIASAKGCAALHLRNTRYDGYAAAARPPVGGDPAGQPWREIWSMAACGTVIDVPVTFIPDATGTTISTQSVRPGGK